MQSMDKTPVELKNTYHLIARADTNAFVAFIHIVRKMRYERSTYDATLDGFLQHACRAATLAVDLRYEWEHPGTLDHYELRKPKPAPSDEMVINSSEDNPWGID